jgi:hypothetical protein
MSHKAHVWLSKEGASTEALRKLVSEVKGLPSAYVELLRLGNGGEVGLKVSPFNLCLDSVEAALGYWKSGTYTMKGVFIFGGNGGGELLAFDMRQSGVTPVISFDPIDPEGSIERVAPDFEQFMTFIEGYDA